MKKEQFEKVAKWGGGIAVVILAGGIALALLKSMLAILACGFTALAAVNIWPVAVTRLANWKYNQLRKQAIENPMPTLIRAYDEAVARFKEKRSGVVQFSTTIKNFKSRIEDYEKRSADTSSMQAMYENMKRALDFQVQRLTEQQQNLEEAKVCLAETQDKYNMALDMQAANNSLEDFTGESGMDFTLQREAFAAVTSKLNEGFARMEVSMALDYNKLPNELQTTQVRSLQILDQKLKETEFA